MSRYIDALEARIVKTEDKLEKLKLHLQEMREFEATKRVRITGVRDRVKTVVAEKGDTKEAFEQLVSEGYNKASVYCYMSRLRHGKI